MKLSGKVPLSIIPSTPNKQKSKLMGSVMIAFFGLAKKSQKGGKIAFPRSK